MTAAVAALLVAGTVAAAAQALRVPADERFDACVPPGLPSGWSSTRVRYPSVDDFVTTSSVPLSVPNAAVATDATVGQALVSPPINISGRGDVSVSFSMRRSSTFAAAVILEVSHDGGSSYSHQVGDTLRAVSLGSYIGVVCRLPRDASLPDTLRFRWRILPDVAGSSGTLRLDDIRFDAAALHDLALDSILVESPCEENAPFTVSIRVRNAGALDVDAFDVDVVADFDEDRQADPEEPAGRSPGGALPPGGAMTVQVGLPPLRAGHTSLLATVREARDQDSTNNSRTAVVEIAYAPGSIAVNEIMYAPPSGEPEWVELLSLRGDTVDLTGWSVSDSDPTARKSIAQQVVCGPGGFVVLTRDTTALRAARVVSGMAVQVPGFPVLNNSGDAFVVYDRSGNVVDSVRYDPSMGGAVGGVSLERRDPAGYSLDTGNWSSSRDTLGATPGSPNSIVLLDHDLCLDGPLSVTSPPRREAVIPLVVRNCGRLPLPPTMIELYDDTDRDSVADAGEFVSAAGTAANLLRGESLAVFLRFDDPAAGRHHLIGLAELGTDQRPEDNLHHLALDVGYPPGSVTVNEVMYDPLSGGAEYVELVNASQDPIDLADWSVSDNSEDARSGLIVEPHLIVSPGEYLAITGDSVMLRTFPGLTAATRVLVGQSLPGLNNSGDSIIVRDPAGHIVDSLRYLPSWHSPAFVDVTGRSLEKIRPELPSSVPPNWSTCTLVTGGTPGRANSILAPSVAAGTTLSLAPNPFSPDADGREDFLLVRYTLPGRSAAVTITVYDVVGRRVRRILSGQPGAFSGDVVWDGRDEQQRRVRMGVYVILLEALDEAGGTMLTAKAVAVVGGKL